MENTTHSSADTPAFALEEERADPPPQHKKPKGLIGVLVEKASNAVHSSMAGDDAETDD
jgi:hypothetical protein